MPSLIVQPDLAVTSITVFMTYYFILTKRVATLYATYELSYVVDSNAVWYILSRVIF